ncbi:MAG: tetratricopeptide repeat protein [Candidatus Hydrogenedentota bacterium]
MSPNNQKQRYDQAQKLFQAKRYGEALALLEGLVQEMPNNADVLYASALTLASMGRKDEALPLCDKLIAAHGHDKAQRLKARILQREPSPDLIEMPQKKRTGLSARQWAPLLALIVLLAAAAGLYFYLSADGAGTPADAAGPAVPAAATASTKPPADGPAITLVNNTSAHIAVWVDAVGATDEPAVSVAAKEEAAWQMPEGQRQIRARAVSGDERFYTVDHPIAVSGPGNLVFFTEPNDFGVTELKFRLE